MNPYPDDPNFMAIVSDLNVAGFNLTEIAEIVGTSQPQISRLKDGVTTSPGYTLGTRLVQLHRKEMLKLRRRKKVVSL